IHPHPASDGPHSRRVPAPAHDRIQAGDPGLRRHETLPGRAERRRLTRARGVLFVEREANFERDLPVIDLAVLNVAARFSDLEPAHVSDGFSGALQGILYRFFDALR